MKMETSKGWWTAVIMAWGAVVFGLDYFGLGEGLRPALIVGFLLVCPGFAYVRMFNFPEVWVQWTLAIAVSLAIDAIVAAFLVYGGIPLANLGLIIIWVITLAGSLLPGEIRFTTIEDY